MAVSAMSYEIASVCTDGRTDVRKTMARASAHVL